MPSLSAESLTVLGGLKRGVHEVTKAIEKALSGFCNIPTPIVVHDLDGGIVVQPLLPIEGSDVFYLIELRTGNAWKFFGSVFTGKIGDEAETYDAWKRSSCETFIQFHTESMHKLVGAELCTIEELSINH